jgi:hypothetical protein
MYGDIPAKVPYIHRIYLSVWFWPTLIMANPSHVLYRSRSVAGCTMSSCVVVQSSCAYSIVHTKAGSTLPLCHRTSCLCAHVIEERRWFVYLPLCVPTIMQMSMRRCTRPGRCPPGVHTTPLLSRGSPSPLYLHAGLHSCSDEGTKHTHAMLGLLANALNWCILLCDQFLVSQPLHCIWFAEVCLHFACCKKRRTCGFSSKHPLAKSLDFAVAA